MTTDWQIDEALAAARDLEIERELMERAARDAARDERVAADDRILMFQARLDGMSGAEPYVEQADANPERVNNGCQIYKANQ